MLKKTFYAIVFSTISMASYSFASEFNSQLEHVRTQVKTVLRSWQKAEMTVRQAKKMAPELYDTLETTAEQIVALESVNAKMIDVADQQYNTIVDANAAYKPVDFLTVYFPEKKKTMKPYLYLLCSAMANRKYRLLLWRKLVKKEKELETEVGSEENIDTFLDKIAK